MKPIDPYEYLRMKIVKSNPRFSAKAFVVMSNRKRIIVADESIRLGDVFLAVKKVMTEGAPKTLLATVFKKLVVKEEWNLKDDVLHHQSELMKEYLAKILLKKYQ